MAQFVNLLQSYGLNPKITNATRITANTSTLIDNIFTNDNNKSISGSLICTISDHLPIFTVIESEIKRIKSPNSVMYYRNFSKRNKELFFEEMGIKSHEIYSNDVNENVDKLINIYKETFDKYFPEIKT